MVGQRRDFTGRRAKQVSAFKGALVTIEKEPDQFLGKGTNWAWIG
jgi:hypothetical protein